MQLQSSRIRVAIPPDLAKKAEGVLFLGRVTSGGKRSCPFFAFRVLHGKSRQPGNLAFVTGGI
jgi:hypothetical protein